MNSKVYKLCAFPQRVNTLIKTPNKVFVHVPHNKTVRHKWLTLARRDPTSVTANSPIYFCEDHFDVNIYMNIDRCFTQNLFKLRQELPNDMENYMQYHLMGSVGQVRMKPGCMPTKFECQPDRKTRTPNPIECPFILKKRRMTAIEDSIKDLEARSMVSKHNERNSPVYRCQF